MIPLYIGQLVNVYFIWGMNFLLVVFFQKIYDVLLEMIS